MMNGMHGARREASRAAARPTGAEGSGAALPRTVREFLETAIRGPWPADELRMITFEAPVARPERILGFAPDEPAVFWDGAHHEDRAVCSAGSGVAHVVTAAGPGRFEDIRAGAEALWPRIRVVTQPGTSAPRPRLFGGFAFLAGASQSPWERFGDARFILPRLLYTASAASATLSIVAAAPEENGRGPEVVLRDVARAFAMLGGDEPPRAGAAAPLDTTPAATVEDMTQDAWTEAVASIRSRIAEGRAAKIVAARRTVLRLDAVPDVAVVLERLEREGSPEVRFALRCGAATLLGATPERLVSRRGLTIRTEALAGSIGVGQDERLLASAKDAEEHALVVDAIADALAPLCARLDHPPEPRIQRLRHVLHLQTQFEGRLSGPVHVLELVRRLHPTPAVGGTPTAEALDWIAAREPVDRGWYAAPVGWFDAEGDGDFVVALRSGLLHHDRAYLYAGAGIVRDSDPAAEYAETDTKLKTMMNALGFAG